MRYHSAITATISVAAVAEAMATPTDDSINARPEIPNGYKIEPMTWRGVIEKRGPELSFNGTIDEVTQKIQAVKKDFTWEGPHRRDLGAPDKNTHIQERGTKTGIICGVGGEDVSLGPLTANMEDSADKLSKMSGTCSVPAGPRVCAALVCTRNAAVWLCNDNSTPISLSCSSLASYVDDIVGKCGQDYNHGDRYCRGQEFDSDNFNVAVGWKSQC
ncbi:hypothetical protein F5Y09DRAFT_314487 [Xylaria sp. FL1042]|nr:hypothetical protein F5Y09DRAFT_314487 [Xylaria sp. FL1042]